MHKMTSTVQSDKSAYLGVAALSGSSRGTVNQKLEPTPTLEMAPICPPNTETCLLQMLSPKPVPPCVRGLCISSSVPCASHTDSEILADSHSIILLATSEQALAPVPAGMVLNIGSISW